MREPASCHDAAAARSKSWATQTPFKSQPALWRRYILLLRGSGVHLETFFWNVMRDRGTLRTVQAAPRSQSCLRTQEKRDVQPFVGDVSKSADADPRQRGDIRTVLGSLDRRKYRPAGGNARVVNSR